MSNGWLRCRVDGCAYGMWDVQGISGAQKKWMIKTNDEAFHASCMAKVLHGDGQNCLLSLRAAVFVLHGLEEELRFGRPTCVMLRPVNRKRDELEHMLGAMHPPGDHAQRTTQGQYPNGSRIGWPQHQKS